LVLPNAEEAIKTASRGVMTPETVGDTSAVSVACIVGVSVGAVVSIGTLVSVETSLVICELSALALTIRKTLARSTRMKMVMAAERNSKLFFILQGTS
jgi:hypothetical protein